MNPSFQLMHNKYVVMDGTSVFMGAGNFTSAGFRRNYENFYFFDLPELAAQYQMHFEHLFNDLGSQLNEIPEPVEQ
jgi:phosphatidylserine/phosphatidylglycerophosphate/cardiolipin synthase-like enzyme